MDEMNLQEVLKMLEITKLEDIDKYTALQVARILPRIGESAFETIFNQVPNFLHLLEEGFKTEAEVVSKALEYNAESMRNFNIHVNFVLEALRECQKKPDISSEDAKYYMEKMLEVLNISAKKETENKVFIERNIKVISDSNNKNRALALVLLAGIAGIGLLALGTVTNNQYLIQKSTDKTVKKIIDVADKKGLIK